MYFHISKYFTHTHTHTHTQTDRQTNTHKNSHTLQRVHVAAQHKSDKGMHAHHQPDNIEGGLHIYGVSVSVTGRGEGCRVRFE